jgi:hypothetical protein
MTATTDVPAGLEAFLIEAPKGPEQFNVLIYGAPKTGKSTAAATAPGPILWVNAEGPGALGYARKIAAERKTQILEVRVERDIDARQLLRDVIVFVRKRDDIQSVVVDTLAKLRDALIRQIVVPGAKNSIQQFGEVAKILEEFVQVMRDLPVNLVLVAHQEIADADGDRIVQPLIGGALTAKIPGEVDVIAYAGSFVDEESGERRYVGQLVERNGRVAGDRSGALGPVRDLDLSEWLGVYREALTPAGDDPFFEGSKDGGTLEDAIGRGDVVTEPAA